MEDLLTELEARGVADAGALVSRALELGPSWFAARLARDAGAWSRYRAAFDALRARRDPDAIVSGDLVTVGAVAWTYATGAIFTDAIAREIAAPSPMH